jgi:hypothetical protein
LHDPAGITKKQVVLAIKALIFIAQIMTSIISDGEARQILTNDLRKQALEKRADELKAANGERQVAIMAEIDCEIEKELQKWDWRNIGGILH